MATKGDLQHWVQEALKQAGGSAPLIHVAKDIWRHHERELADSGNLFYTWQYDMRWAAERLRKRGVMKGVAFSPRGTWELTTLSA
jgi:hypothetical protein